LDETAYIFDLNFPIIEFIYFLSASTLVHFPKKQKLHLVDNTVETLYFFFFMAFGWFFSEISFFLINM